MATIIPLERTFDYRVRNFPEEVYAIERGNHLTKLLKVLLGDAGTGGLSKIQTVARLSESLNTTHYTELDYFFGVFLGFPRLPEEMYSYDPFSDQLTAGQWNEVEIRDGMYRDRIKKYLRATIMGGTHDGVALAAEAACGYPCQILEMWRYTDDLGLNTDPGRFGGTNPKEFVVVPLTDDLSMFRRRNIYNVVNKIKPADTVCTVDEGAYTITKVIAIRHAVSPSEYFEVRRYVTSSNAPKPDYTRYFWVSDGEEVAAPNFAHMTHQETVWHLNNTVTFIDSFEIGRDDVIRQLPPALSYYTQTFGPWRNIETADSPDNYPNGKYPGDPNKLDRFGNYIFAWANQAEYETWLIENIEAVGGEVSAGRFRIPLSAEYTTGAESHPKDALAAQPVEIQSLYYVR